MECLLVCVEKALLVMESQIVQVYIVYKHCNMTNNVFV